PEPRQRLCRILAKCAVLCAGAIERPIAFGDNDRPGIMLASAVRTYVNRFGVAPGRRALLFTDNDDAFRTASDLAHAGVEVVALVDAGHGPSRHAQAAAEASRAPYFPGAVIERVRGGQGIKGVAIRDTSGVTKHFDCDLVAMSGSWNPSVHLTSHLNGKPKWSERLSALVPDALPPGMSVAGAAQGDFGLAACLAGGEAAGAEAAQGCGFTPKPNNRRDVSD